MANPRATPLIAPANGGPICDRIVEAVAHNLELASAGTPISDAAIDLIQICGAPLIRELQAFRARAAEGLELSTPTNVVHLPRHTDARGDA